MNTILILLAVGLVAGFMSGLVGIGGGVIIVPILVYFLHQNQKMAQGTTLFMFLLPIGLLGVYNYYKGGQIDFKSAFIMATTFIIGSYLGSKTALTIDTKLVKQIFGAMIILVGFKMLLNK
ncbi:MAG: sulfite exporter TauE/SafE family protein [Bacteroidia bacterium]|nr:sulfite exporter TauE/SafE family protein [Bacteroidia bacterium]